MNTTALYKIKMIHKPSYVCTNIQITTKSVHTYKE